MQEDETVEVGTALVTIGDGSGGGEAPAAPPPRRPPAAEAPAAEAPAAGGTCAEAAPLARRGSAAPQAEAAPAEAELRSGCPAARGSVRGAGTLRLPRLRQLRRSAAPAACSGCAAPAPAAAPGACRAPAARRAGSRRCGCRRSGRGTRADRRRARRQRRLRDPDRPQARERAGRRPGDRHRHRCRRPHPQGGRAVGRRAAAAPAAGGSGRSAAPLEVSPLRGTTQPMSRLRKVVAERAVVSMQSTAQLTTVVEVDVTKVAAFRDKVKGDFQAKTGDKLSFLPFFALAAAEALQAYPVINATVDGDTIVYPRPREHLASRSTPSAACSPRCSATPASSTSPASPTQIADLAARTRDNKLKPDELAGGTFTLTNTGSRGALFDTPVVFLPQVAILGTGIVDEEAGRDQRRTATTRSRSARRSTSRCRTTTASSTVRTPLASSSRSRTASRAATSRATSASSHGYTSRNRQPASLLHQQERGRFAVRGPLPRMLRAGGGVADDERRVVPIADTSASANPRKSRAADRTRRAEGGRVRDGRAVIPAGRSRPEHRAQGRFAAKQAWRAPSSVSAARTGSSDSWSTSETGARLALGSMRRGSRTRRRRDRGRHGRAWSACDPPARSGPSLPAGRPAPPRQRREVPAPARSASCGAAAHSRKASPSSATGRPIDERTAVGTSHDGLSLLRGARVGRPERQEHGLRLGDTDQSTRDTVPPATRRARLAPWRASCRASPCATDPDTRSASSRKALRSS